MNDQIKETFAWRCLKCGRVLLTPGGVKRHLEKCKMTPQVMEGQVTLGEVLKAKEEPK